MNLERIVGTLVAQALAEDVGSGDVTTLACVDERARADAVLLVKADGALAGLGVARAVFAAVDPRLVWIAHAEDGTSVRSGSVAANVAGSARSILTGERVALNFVQRLSGIASLTRRFVERVAGTGAVILDTRKTTPGLRALEKYAVRCGGGRNHRTGLYDQYLVKDNHIRAAGSLTQAVERIRAVRDAALLLEIEAATLDQVREASGLAVDRVLLDNMDPATVGKALAILDAAAHQGAPVSALRPEGARRWPQVEVSGGLTLETVRPMAELGVDFLSIGALTHSAPALDLSLEIVSLG